MSHVAASETQDGKQAALVPFLNCPPRAPFGPSDTLGKVNINC